MHTIDDASRAALHLRSQANLSSLPRPFLRWAGSKRALVQHLVAALPEQYGRYFEPFLGSAAVYFMLRPRSAHLNDACAPLIEVYDALAADHQGVIAAALKHPVEEQRYYEVRSLSPRSKIDRAGQFIYLNHACFNGLYRVNLNGRFNVPYGRPKTTHVLDEANIEACAALLKAGRVTLTSQDFESAVSTAVEGDLVFLDPPYVTRHNNNGFIEYNERIFSWRDQIRLANVARSLAERGCSVIVTNAAHADVINLYEGFESFVIERPSTIAGKRDRRGRTSEMVFYSREGADG